MNKNTKIILGVIVIALVVWGFSALNKQKTATTTGGRVIKIGMIAGLTGPYAAIGENYARGAQLAVEKAKTDNPKYDVQLIIENDEFDPKKSLSAYEKLVGIDKVSALINETTPSIEAIYGRVTKLGIPVMQGGEQSVDPTDDNIIQIQPGQYKAEVALGEYVKNLGKRKVVAFVQNYPAMLRFFRGFKEGYGGEVSEVLIGFGDKELRTHALKAVQQSPETIVFMMFPDDGALLVKEINNLYKNKTRPFFVFDANFQAGFSNYQKVLGDLKFLDGSVVGIVQQDMASDFVAAYKQKWNQDPALGSEYGFDAVITLVNSYNADTDKWIENIKTSQFQGVSGLIRFDNVGVRIPDFKNTIIKNGQIVY